MARGGAKINILAMLAAAGAFFLPWLEVSCSVEGKSVLLFSQTGVQVLTGEAEAGPELKKLRSTPGAIVKEEGTDPAVLVVIASVLVGFGVLASLVAAGGTRGTGLVGIFAATALALIGTQMILKFPALRESHDPDNPFQNEVNEKAREFVTSRYREGLYVELGALAVPVLVLLVGGGRQPV